MESLVTTEWLAANLSAADLRILDCSWHMPVDGRDGAAEFEQAHIPGALNIPLNDLPDRIQELDPSAWIITYCT